MQPAEGAAAASAGGPIVAAQPAEAEMLRVRLDGELRALTAHVLCRDGALQLPRDLGWPQPPQALFLCER